MKRKIVSGIMLSLLLIGMLTLAFNIQPAKASGTIYIRANGSIDPPTANITSADNITYTFTGNVNDSIVVERDNIVVDGVGYTLQGTGSGTGIDLTGRNNITIKNIQIKAFEWGIWLTGSKNSIISGNNIKNTLGSINLYGSSSNTISGNNITTDNAHGIYLDNSSNNRIIGNNITASYYCYYGILLSYYSSNNIVSGNNLKNHFISMSLDESSNNNSIYGNNIANNGEGIGLWSSSNNSIYENNIANNDGGISLWGSSNNNSIYGNNIANNGDGILLGDSSNNSIYHNNFINNGTQAGTYESYDNIWDDGYPSGGNYWSDHNPPDFYNGSNQDVPGRDGIGDTPYVIDENNTDRYPLIYPYGYIPTPDIDGSGIIDMMDIAIICYAAFTSPGHPRWDPYADIDGNGVVDMMDISLACYHFLEHV